MLPQAEKEKIIFEEIFAEEKVIKFVQFAGLTSCCYTYCAQKMHQNIPFPDEKTQKFSGKGLILLPTLYYAKP